MRATGFVARLAALAWVTAAALVLAGCGGSGGGLAHTPTTSPPYDGPSTSGTAQPGSHDLAPEVVDFVNSSHGWVAGPDGIAGSTDGGYSWHHEFADPAHRTFAQLDFIDASHGWAVEQSGAIWATSDGGRSWAQRKGFVAEVAGFPGPVVTVDFVDPSDGYAFTEYAVRGSNGPNGPWLWRTSNGGRTWHAVTLPSGHGGSGTGGPAGRQICFTSKEVGWVVRVPALGSSDPHALLATADGGATWSSQLTSPTDGAAPTVLAHGTTPTAPTPTYAITGGILACSTLDPSVAWFLATGNPGMSQMSYSVYVTTDFGRTWTPVIDSPTAGSGPGPAFPRQMTPPPGVAAGPGSSPVNLVDVGGRAAVVVGTDLSVSLHPPYSGVAPLYAMASTDAGATWRDIPPESGGLPAQVPGIAGSSVSGFHLPAPGGGLSFVSPSVGWVLGLSATPDARDASTLLETTDGGVTWRQVHVFAASGGV